MLDEELIVDALTLMIREYSKKSDKWSIDDLNSMFEFYMEQSDYYRQKHADYVIKECAECVQRSDLGEDYYFIMSFLLRATKNRKLYNILIKRTITDETLEKENKFFLYYQFIRFNFLNSEVADCTIKNLLDDLYSHIYDAYYKEVAESYEIIPKEERNKDLVIVFISQVLGLNHGPTKTLLDRCKILKEELNKNVYIINSAESVSVYGAVSFFRSETSNYWAELNNEDYLTYGDDKYAFLQCPNEMPQVTLIQQILDVIKEEKPYFILTIGGNSIVSDICSNVVPTLTISTVVSERAVTRGQFQAIGRKVSEEDILWMKKHDYSKEHIIESLFTSAFKKQTHRYTREQLGLPSKGFIAVFVGARLDFEIDEECIKMIYKLNSAGIYVAFMGNFKRYYEIVKTNKLFEKYTINLGLQEDVLAVNECCDLYVNPKRVGGGTSVAEALFKGVPVVTIDFGDGALGAGKEFVVSDYDEMYEKIIKYASDKEFYEIMSKKARERAKCLTDSKSQFVKIVETMEKSERF